MPTPHDFEHGADGYYQQLIARENALVELQTARLMGNFMFLSEAVPVQTQSPRKPEHRPGSASQSESSLG